MPSITALTTPSNSALPLTRIPECMTVPMFESPHHALGWAYVIERSTRLHPELYRHLGSLIPGEIAFASSYLKCYFGDVGERWWTFVNRLATVATDDHPAVVDGAIAGMQHQHRWLTMGQENVASGVHPFSGLVTAPPPANEAQGSAIAREPA
jgi:heme oxygenase